MTRPYPNPTVRGRAELAAADRHVYAQPSTSAVVFRRWDPDKEYADTWPMRVPPQWVTFGCPPPRVRAPLRLALAAGAIALTIVLCLVDLVVAWSLCSMYAARARELVG